MSHLNKCLTQQAPHSTSVSLQQVSHFNKCIASTSVSLQQVSYSISVSLNKCLTQQVSHFNKCLALQVSYSTSGLLNKRLTSTSVSFNKLKWHPTSRKFEIASQIQIFCFLWPARSLRSQILDFQLVKAQKTIPCPKFAWHMTRHLSCK